MTSKINPFSNINKMKFKKLKGVTDEIRQVIYHDLECLELKDSEDNDYHYDLLRGNLVDLLGEKEVE